MAVFADHGVSLSVYKIVCVCVGLGLSCRAWTTSVSLRKWLVKQLVLAKLSIMIPELVSCQYLVVVSQLCLKFHCVLLFGHLASKNHLPGFEKPHTGLLPIFRCSKASNLVAWCGMCFGRCDIGTVQTEDFTATSEQVSRPTLCAHWANEHEFGIQWGVTKHPRLAGGFPESLVFLEPCVPGTLSSWNPRFRNLGATHSVYWNPGFAEPRRADLLSRCAPPCQRLLVDRAYMVLEPWFPWKLVFWDPVRSMNLGTTHGVYPTPGLFPEPRNLARTLVLWNLGWASWKLLFRNLVPVRNLWHNPGSISKLWVRIRGGSRNLVGTQCCWNLAGTLVPQTLGFQDVSKLVFRWFQNRSKPW